MAEAEAEAEAKRKRKRKQRQASGAAKQRVSSYCEAVVAAARRREAGCTGAPRWRRRGCERCGGAAEGCGGVGVGCVEALAEGHAPIEQRAGDTDDSENNNRR